MFQTDTETSDVDAEANFIFSFLQQENSALHLSQRSDRNEYKIKLITDLKDHVRFSKA